MNVIPRGFLFLVCALFAIAGAVHTSEAAPVLLNGSFESPPIAPGSIVSGGGDFWIGGSGAFLAANGGAFGQTPFGNQYLGLSRIGLNDQNIPGFVSGHTYLLGLFFASLDGGTNPTLAISLGGVASGVSIFTAPSSGPYGSGTIPFQFAEVSFTAIADGALHLRIQNIAGGTLGVDNVTLRDALSLPEAGSGAVFLILGILGLAGAKRACASQPRRVSVFAR